jgi:hypothetical protein
MKMCRQTCLAQCVQKMEILHLLAATAMVLCSHLHSLQHTETTTAELIPHSVFCLVKLVCVIRGFHGIVNGDYSLAGFDTMLTGNLLLTFHGSFHLCLKGNQRILLLWLT